ncbi:MAG: tetratricopeptide repeat protein [Desulfosudaceae bacterium]
MPPGRIPVAARPDDYIKAALGLEQAGHLSGALECYQAAVQRWPDHVDLRLALGNAWYAAGNPERAGQAFAAAAKIEPDLGVAWNNLAHVLAEMGRWTEAEQAALRAVAAGGERVETFRRTLAEIRSHRPR